MKKILLFLFSVCFSFNSYAALSAGDIAFVQYNADGTDNFAFVALVNIAAGETIYFTDNGWTGTALNTNEGTVAWTAPSDISCGTVIPLGGLAFTVSGDQVIAYQGTSGNPVTFIAALNNQGAGVWQDNASTTSNSALPTGLTDGVNAVAVNEVDNVVYDANTLIGAGSVVGAAINTNGAWTGGSNTNTQTFSGTFEITGCVALPVVLISFNTMLKDNSVSLNWQTASEVDNDYFSVEYSIDARNYKEIGQVNGAGTTQARQNYAFTHKTPANGLNYYRLKQIDFDGAFEYSQVQVVEVKREKPISIFPSQAFETITVDLAEAVKEETVIGVYDVMGRMVLSQVMGAEATRSELNVANLAKGHYFIQLQTGSERYTERFIKMN